jgi:hypothetical protein
VLVLGASLCSAAIVLQLFCSVDLTAGILDFSRTRDLSWSVKVFEEILFTTWG